MVPTERFLDGLFAPHGGLPAQAAVAANESQMARVVRILSEWFYGSREPRQSDFALVH